MKKLCILFTTFLLASIINAQSVGVNDDGSTPHASAMLDIKSTTKGVLIPRVSLTATNVAGPVSSPLTSLLVYNTVTAGSGVTGVTPGFYFWNGSGWEKINSGSVSSNAWLLTGNSGTNPASNFIGTTDNQPLLFKANNLIAGQVHSSLLGNANNNVSFGLGALASNVFNPGQPSLGNFNVAIGNEALFYNTTGSHNVAMGLSTLTANTSGIQNVANGSYALQSNTEGFGNTAVGYTSLSLNTTGTNNTALGGGASYTNITGSSNTAVGTSSLKLNQAGNANTAVGYTALFSNTADNNTAVGYSALFTNTTGVRNTALGMSSLLSNNIGTDNTATGHSAMQSNTTGSLNTATGNQALLSNTEGFYNSAHGYQSLLLNTTGTYNTALGSSALVTNTEGMRNTALGSFADVTTPGLINATAIGYNTKVSQSNSMVLGNGVNVGIGTSAPNVSSVLDLSSNSRGILIPRLTTTERNMISAPAKGLLVYDSTLNSFYYHSGTAWAEVGAGGVSNAWQLGGNTGTNQATNFIGTTDVQSLQFRVNNNPAGFISATTADIALGQFALSSSTTGYYNSAIGYSALAINTEGYSNSALGAFVLSSNTTGHSNTGIGSLSLVSNTSGNENTAIGRSALNSNTTGYSNTANGVEALYRNTTGYGNTAIGLSALRANTTGILNAAMGDAALAQNTTGNNNTASGFVALEGNRTGNNNTAFGALALSNTFSSENNTAIGHRSGFNFNNGWNNVFVGAGAEVDGEDYYNVVAVGSFAVATSPNQVRLGNTSIQSLFCQGAYASTTSASANMVVNSAGQIMRSTSSARYKAAIEDLDINTENIYQLQPRSYTSVNDGQKYFGLVAEEVHKVIPELVEYAKEREVIPGSKSEHLIPDAVRYPMLSVLLLKEMQKNKKTLGEQQTIIDKQNDELKKLKEQVDALAKMIQTLSANK